MDLTESLEFAERLVSTLRAASEHEASAEANEQLKRANEGLEGSFAKLKAESRELQAQIETWRKEYGEYATLDARRLRIEELDRKIAEREGQLKKANQGWAELQAKVDGIGA